MYKVDPYQALPDLPSTSYKWGHNYCKYGSNNRTYMHLPIFLSHFPGVL